MAEGGRKDHGWSRGCRRRVKKHWGRRADSRKEKILLSDLGGARSLADFGAFHDVPDALINREKGK